MIVLDASAVLAIIMIEEDAQAYLEMVSRSSATAISVASVMECSIKLQRRFGAGQDTDLETFLRELRCDVAALDATQLKVARDAFGRYGKGMGHPARLNYGDCFSYALAKTRNLPLLYKGNDFIHTDIVSARV